VDLRTERSMKLNQQRGCYSIRLVTKPRQVFLVSVSIQCRLFIARLFAVSPAHLPSTAAVPSTSDVFQRLIIVICRRTVIIECQRRGASGCHRCCLMTLRRLTIITNKNACRLCRARVLFFWVFLWFSYSPLIPLS